MSTERKTTWLTVVTAVLVAVATAGVAVLERDPVGVGACVDVLLRGSSYKSLVVPAVPSQ